MTTTPFTMSDLHYYAEVIGMVAGEKRVGWLNEDGDAVFGTARSIVKADGTRMDRDTDVRDAALRVTVEISGVELLMPLAEATRRMVDMEFMAAD